MPGFICASAEAWTLSSVFDPLMLAGHFELYGELRLFVVSGGGPAKLDVLVVERGGIHFQGKAKPGGHVDLFFFEIKGCVHVKIGDVTVKPEVPILIEKLSLKSRSPALAQGTGTDRPIDTSLGEGSPAPDDKIVAVPIDSIPVLSMIMLPQANGLQFQGQAVLGSSGLSGDPNAFAPRGSENYQYKLTEVKIERDGGGPALLSVLMHRLHGGRSPTLRRNADGRPRAPHR